MREAIGGDATAIKSHQERNQEHSGAQSRALRSAIKSHQERSQEPAIRSAIKSTQERNQEPSGAQSRAIRSAIKSTQVVSLDTLEQRHRFHSAHRRQRGRVLAARRSLDELLIDLM